MANVETEQNKTLATQQEGGEQSASINLHEENLEALLNALSGAGTAALAPREAVPTPQPAAPVATPSAPVFATPAPIENISVDVQIQTPAAKASSAAQAFEEAKPLETSEAKPVDTSEAKPLETSAAPALQIAPVAPVQQDMSSKLALLSSIKQRRAITVRPDSGEVPAQPVQSSSPLPAEKPVANQQNANHQTVLRTLEQAKESTPAPTPRATTPQDILVEEKSALPAKKVWTSNSSTRTEETLREEKPAREQKLRRDERSRQEQKQEPLEQEPGNDDAPQAHVAQRQEAAKKAAIAKASACRDRSRPRGTTRRSKPWRRRRLPARRRRAFSLRRRAWASSVAGLRRRRSPPISSWDTIPSRRTPRRPARRVPRERPMLRRLFPP
jgi:hypothetical protein